MKKFFKIFGIMSCILATICSVNMHKSAVLTSTTEDMSFTSKAVYLYDVASSQTLYSKEEKTHLPVASMVKMMTILLTLEEIDKGNLALDTMVTTSENASGMGGSQIFIDPFVEYSVEDLLKGVIVSSANDASVALAEHISGNEKSFVNKMNEKAKSLGMMDTNYSNCTGLPAPEQYSCAKDSALILNEVIKHDIYHKYSTIWMDELTHPSGRKTGLVNTNRLIRYYQGCDSGKTGSTNEAGCCLTASAKRGNMRLISVVIGAPNSQTRFNEASALFNYGFANFENKDIINKDVILKTLSVSKGKINEINIYAKEDFSILTKKGEQDNVQIDYELPQTLKAPLSSGNKVGKAIISRDGNVLKEVELEIRQDIEKLSLKDTFGRIIEEW